MVSPLSGTSSTKQTSKHNITRDTKIKDNLTVTRGDVGGEDGWKEGKGYQEQLQRTHGQNQGGMESEEGRGNGWGGGVSGGGKCRQLYLNNNKTIIVDKKKNIP